MRILLALGLVGALAATACGGRSGAATSTPTPAATPAALTVTIQPGFVANRRARTFRLTCAPAGGSLPHPAAACLALARHPGLLAPLRRCRRVLADLGRVQVRGTVDGRPVALVFACPATRLRWRALAAALRVPDGRGGFAAR